MRLGYWTRVLLWTVVACAFFVFVTGAGGASGSWGVGVEALLPPNAVTRGQHAGIDSISCPSFGNCTAVGTYETSLGEEGLLLSETSGSWHRGVEAALPANAGLTSGVSLSSVSCPSAGNCTAVGSYPVTSGTQRGTAQGLLLRETAGTWSTGLEATLPANAITSKWSAELVSVSCPATGSCGAVGYLYDGTDDGFSADLLLTETSGHWATGTEPALPADAASAANQQAELAAVSCPSAGNCTAVGTYSNQVRPQAALIVTETGGSWSKGVKPTLPANAATGPWSALSSVSCVSAGNCTAVGSYTDNTQLTEGLLLTKNAGAWGTGVEAILPANAEKSSSAAFAGLGGLSSVSCASAGNCSAVGVYADTSLTEQGLLLNETGGHWATGIEAALPANARGGQNGTVVLGLDSISCPSAGNCDAVGGYVDNADLIHGLLLNETAGNWATGVEANLPSNAAATQYSDLSTVSCAGPGSCNAGGSYEDSASNYQPVHIGTIPPLFTLQISKNGAGAGTVTSSPAGISCGATCSHNYSSGTQVTLTASAAAGSTFAGWSGSGCSGTGTCKVMMSAAKSVTATFKQKPPPPQTSSNFVALTVIPEHWPRPV